MTKFLLLQRKIAHIKINFTFIIRFSPGISICLTDTIILPDIKYVLKLLHIIFIYQVTSFSSCLVSSSFSRLFTDSCAAHDLLLQWGPHWMNLRCICIHELGVNVTKCSILLREWRKDVSKKKNKLITFASCASMWWSTFVIPELKSVRQEDYCKF